MAIAARWRAADEDERILNQLRAWNMQLRDQRIAEAVMATAHDAARPTSIRLAALQTLVSYFDPSSTVEWRSLENPPPVGGLVHVMHARPRVGAQQPRGDLPDSVHAISRELAADPNPAVARAAKFLWQAFTDARPNADLLSENALGVVHVCGKKFRVLNRSDIDLSVELLTAPGRPTVQLRMPAHATRDRLLDVPDTVRLLFGGKVVVSAGRGPDDCR